MSILHLDDDSWDPNPLCGLEGPVTPDIDAVTCPACNWKHTALAALKDALPLLIRLGDFIGNGEGGPYDMSRCDAVLGVRDALAEKRTDDELRR